MHGSCLNNAHEVKEHLKLSCSVQMYFYSSNHFFNTEQLLSYCVLRGNVTMFTIYEQHKDKIAKEKQGNANN